MQAFLTRHKTPAELLKRATAHATLEAAWTAWCAAGDPHGDLQWLCYKAWTRRQHVHASLRVLTDARQPTGLRVSDMAEAPASRHALLALQRFEHDNISEKELLQALRAVPYTHMCFTPVLAAEYAIAYACTAPDSVASAVYAVSLVEHPKECDKRHEVQKKLHAEYAEWLATMNPFNGNELKA